MLLLRLIMIVL